MAATTYELPAEWRVDLAHCPTDTVAMMLEYCLRYATLAPSSHNAQPWLFRLRGDAVDIILDTSRGLSVSDPQDREAVMSIGAALFNLRVALAVLQLGCERHPWPEPKDPECLVRVTASAHTKVEASLPRFFDAITRRRTSRDAFREDALSEPDLDALRRAADAEGAALVVVSDYVSRHAVAKLVAEADRRQMADPRFRRELADWLRISDRRRDGIHGYSISDHDVLPAPLVVRTFDVGAGRAAHDQEIATYSPVLAMLTTSRDERDDWLTAGQALQRVVLEATGLGLSYGFLNQPIEDDDLRPEVATTFGTTAFPQLLMRFGYGPPVKPQRRRPVTEMLAR